MFVKEAKKWYKLWSSWLALFSGCITTLLWNNPELLVNLIQNLPEDTRALLSPVVLGVVTSLPIIVRLIKQQSLKESA